MLVYLFISAWCIDDFATIGFLFISAQTRWIDLNCRYKLGHNNTPQLSARRHIFAYSDLDRAMNQLARRSSFLSKNVPLGV